ncbi:hypothetical protein AB1L30_00495 [Bremerella sp. JC817]|uniref:ABC transporter ATP-binding protein n=1 Tax=Bremerella sp. JC817 TaxID=3231756 RepID=UPI00345B00F8
MKWTPIFGPRVKVDFFGSWMRVSWHKQIAAAKLLSQFLPTGDHQIFENPKHPYTKGLLACRPRLDTKFRRLPRISTKCKDAAGRCMPSSCHLKPPDDATIPSSTSQRNPP